MVIGPRVGLVLTLPFPQVSGNIEEGLSRGLLAMAFNPNLWLSTARGYLTEWAWGYVQA